LLGDDVGVSLPLSVGVWVGVGVVVVGVGVRVGVGDMGPTVGDTEVAGVPLDVAGVGVADGAGVAQVGVGVGVGDGRADGARLRTSSSACRSPAEDAPPTVVATGGTDAAVTPLVTSAVTVAVQAADVVELGEAVPLDEVAPAPRVGL
jgi:hypothetical protein